MSYNNDNAPLAVNGEALAIDDQRLVTVDGAVMLIRQTFGIPLPKSRLQKDSAAGRAPRPAMVYGNRYLYRPSEILTYAKTLVKPYRSAI
jgi:hypothetical protein